MQISIVEDEKVWRDKIQAIVEKYCRDNKISCKIHSYASGKEFSKEPDADLLFLDIELSEGEDGFEVAKKLMHSESQCKVCILTSHTELARQGYRVGAFRYIDKRYLEEIEEALDFFMRAKIQDRFLDCDNGSGHLVRIDLDELLLVETSGRKLRYRMWDGREYFCEGQISEAEQNLSPFGFFRVQRSYIVNLRYVEYANSREVTLCNGMKIAIGRAHNEEFKKAFFQWRMWFDD